MPVWHHKFVLKNLVLKDFRIRYRNMSLGMLWSVLNPLVMLGVLVFVFTYLNPRAQEPKFPVFILLGLIPFNFFALCVGSATGCIVENATLVKKVIFPRLILPVSVVLSQGIHLIIQLALLGMFLLIFQVHLHLNALWLLAALLVELVFITGVALICSALNVFFRDVLYIVQSGLTILFWFTPIFYSVKTANENLSHPMYLLFIANPLAGCIEAARGAILYNKAPEPDSFLAAVLAAVLSVVVGVWFFRRVQGRFADYV